MKKTLLISILVFWIFLVWCSKQQWLSEGELFEGQKETLSKNELFNKKMECASIDLEISINQTRKNIEYSIEEVFYSQIDNTCYWIIDVYRNRGITDIWLYDILSKKRLDVIFVSVARDCYFWEDLWNRTFNKECMETLLKFEEKIQILKWE